MVSLSVTERLHSTISLWAAKPVYGVISGFVLKLEVYSLADGIAIAAVFLRTLYFVGCFSWTLIQRLLSLRFLFVDFPFQVSLF
jgi:hypothetical protein